MASLHKTITVTVNRHDWIRAQVEAGGFANESEYLRDLIRRDQAETAKRESLKTVIREGLDSGVGDKSLDDIWRKAEARHAGKNG